MRFAFITSLLGTALTLSLGSCKSFNVTTADLAVSGHYKLSPADLREIERLTLGAGITKPIRSIQAESPDRVQVECGMPWLRDAEMILFTAHRKNGRWLLDKSSIDKHHLIILD